MKKRKPRKGDSVSVYLFYHNDKHPTIFYWTYQTRYHFENTLKGYFVIGDIKGRTPHTVVCYIDNTFECLLTTKKVKKC